MLKVNAEIQECENCITAKPAILVKLPRNVRLICIYVNIVKMFLVLILLVSALQQSQQVVKNTMLALIKA